MTEKQLKQRIISSLTGQGFYVNGHVAPAEFSKNHFRQIQNLARKEQLESNKNFILNHYSLIKQYWPKPESIHPSNIKVELREVVDGTIEHILYRWWNLVWWSVPYQRAYGRQMRFLVWDVTHNAPIGLIGLQSPVLKMSVRDRYLDIPADQLDYIINKSMQAQRLGALPPYNNILGGKLIASILTSNELRKCYCNKYRGAKTLIRERVIESQLLFITTTSAFGKSSIYNRLKYYDETVAQSLGYTQGSGTFHVTDEIYGLLMNYLRQKGIDVNTTFGYGPSRKMKLIDKAFTLLNLKEYHYHNIKREFYIFPIAKNLNNVIKRGVKPVYFQRSVDELTDYWKTRWALPRLSRELAWSNFCLENFFNNFLQDFKLN